MKKGKIKMDVNQIIADALTRGETTCPSGIPAPMWEMAKAQYNASQVASNNAQTSVPTVVSPSSLPTTMSHQGTVPAAFNPSLDHIDPVGMAVDAYFKADFGTTSITADKETKAFANKVVNVVIDMEEVARKMSIKGGVPVQYNSSFDGMMSVDGKPWLTVLEEFKVIDSKATPYVSYDVPMTLLEDLVAYETDPTAPGQVKTVVVAEKGTKIGHTTPTTGRINFQNFIKEIQKIAGSAASGLYQVKVSREDRTKDKFKWAVLKFELVGPYVATA